MRQRLPLQVSQSQLSANINKQFPDTGEDVLALLVRMFVPAKQCRHYGQLFAIDHKG